MMKGGKIVKNVGAPFLVVTNDIVFWRTIIFLLSFSPIFHPPHFIYISFQTFFGVLTLCIASEIIDPPGRV